MGVVKFEFLVEDRRVMGSFCIATEPLAVQPPVQNQLRYQAPEPSLFLRNPHTCRVSHHRLESCGLLCLVLFEQVYDIGNLPQSIRDASRLGGSRAERLVNAREIVVHVVNRHGVDMVFDLLAESVSTAERTVSCSSASWVVSQFEIQTS